MRRKIELRPPRLPQNGPERGPPPPKGEQGVQGRLGSWGGGWRVEIPPPQTQKRTLIGGGEGMRRVEIPPPRLKIGP